MISTPIAKVIRIAQEHGIEVTAEEAGYIVWNETGYPSFWDGDPETVFAEQVHAYFDALLAARQGVDSE